MEKETTCCGPDCCADESTNKSENREISTNPDTIKDTVKSRYSAIAASQSSGCGCDVVESVQVEHYQSLEGYEASADLGLGCGAPTATDVMREGDTVVDLGSGAGSDIFIARSQIGESGFAIGVDFSPQMIELANQNANKLGYKNTRFVLGDIEDLPLPDNSVDVVTSNCVINLAPNKQKVFSEAFRILKPGGRVTISDMVTNTALPPELADSKDLYCACVGGATSKEEYLSLLDEAGFEDIRVTSWRTISLETTIENIDLSQIEVGGLTVIANVPANPQ